MLVSCFDITPKEMENGRAYLSHNKIGDSTNSLADQIGQKIVSGGFHK